MRTFILRLQEDTARDGGPGSLRGLVDEVATGRQVTFRSDRELVAALLAAMAPVQRVTPRGRADSPPADLHRATHTQTTRSPDMSSVKPLLLAGAAAALIAACSSPHSTASGRHNTPPAASPAAATSSAAAGLSGKWSGHYCGTYNGTFTVHWRQSSSRLSGTIKISAFRATTPIHGSVQGSTITFGTVGNGQAITYTGTVSGNSMSGTWKVASGAASGTWSASRS